MTGADSVSPLLMLLFLGLFALFWTAIGALLGLIAGWYALAERFPDRDDHIVLKMGGQSASMGNVRGLPVSMNGCLTLTACEAGLRVGIWRIFGPVCRPFFVPWEEIRAEKGVSLIFARTRLRFGEPQVGTLVLWESVWNILQTACLDDSALSKKRLGRAFKVMVVQTWLLPTAISATLFCLIAAVEENRSEQPPWIVLIAFPAIIFAINPMFQFLRLRRRL